jgi:hypothetical protein
LGEVNSIHDHSDSYRLSFSYHNKKLVLISKRKVNMISPPSDPMKDASGMVGCWYLLEDSRGKTKYIRFIQNPLIIHPEGLVEEGYQQDASRSSQELSSPSDKFTLVVPNIPRVRRFVLYSSPLEADRLNEPAERLISIDLSKTKDTKFETRRDMRPTRALKDEGVISIEKVVDKGSDHKRWTLAILSEGYTGEQIDLFTKDSDKLIERLKVTAPFDRFWNALNIYRINVASKESGAKDPGICGQETGSGANPKTYFNASFCNGSPTKIRRLLLADYDKAFEVVDQNISSYNDAIMIVNAPGIYGGSGRQHCAIYSTNASPTVGIHELGHSAFGLADEYNSYGTKPGPNPLKYQGSKAKDIADPNVSLTIDFVREKWGNFITAGTVLPTMSCPACSTGSGVGSVSVAHVVGAFEGGKYYDCGVYRPQERCLMRVTTDPFCKVCEAKISRDLENFNV